jgi:hypothetical protein
VLAGAVLVGSLIVLGVLQGVVWAQIAPGQQAKVYSDGAYGSLPTADYHPFTALSLFVLAGIAVGLVAGFATWRVRSIRGAATLGALVFGAAAGAAVAYGVGLALVSGVDPATIGATGHELIVVQAPRLATPLVLVAEPAAAAVVYTFLVAWDGRPDLGRAGAAGAGEAGDDGKAGGDGNPGADGNLGGDGNPGSAGVSGAAPVSGGGAEPTS